MRDIRKLSTVLSSLVVLTGTTVLMSAPTLADPNVAADFNPGSNVSIAPYEAPPFSTFAIQYEGVGSQVEDISAANTTWDTYSATTGYKIKPHNNTADCLEQDFGDVFLQPCSAGDGAQDWIFSGNSSDTSIQNVAGGSNGFMGVYSPSENKPVYDSYVHGGFYDHWYLIPNN